MNERALIAHIGSAEPEELEHLIADPAVEEERVLRKYLGGDQFEDLHGEASERGASVREEAFHRKGNVVIIPGIMGSYLSALVDGRPRNLVWPDPIDLVWRPLDLLRLSGDGSSGYLPEYDLGATGLVQFVYLKLTLSLWWKGWRVSRLWFDWRKDLKTAADDLLQHIDRVFGEDVPVHIVAHSMGGLVARTFIEKHHERWERMWDGQDEGMLGGRLVMLGTPNHGAFGVPQLLTGLGMVKILADVNPHHEVSDLLEITNSFVGPYQMLPSPRVSEEWQRLYDSETYARLALPRNVPQPRLDSGLAHHELLASVVVPDRMVYVAGYGRRTQTDIKDYGKLHILEEGYHTTLEGDGTVPHKLGLLETDEGEKVKAYFVRASHMNLPRDGRVLDALDTLLASGTTQVLEEEPSAPVLEAEAASESPNIEQEVREERARVLAGAIQVRSAEPEAQTSFMMEERELIELLMGSF